MDPRSPTPGYRPDIQGLRALAVLAVLGFHAGIPGFEAGYLGVDVFFVVSGFLIGGHLLRSLHATGHVDLWAFYARRARRILPASLTVIALTVLAALLVAAPLRRTEIAVDAVWAALSGANLRFAIVGTDYLAGTAPSPLQHYWSLGVEEQFYLVVPLLLIGLFALLAPRPRALLAAGLVVIAGSFVVCLLSGIDSPWAYFGLPARAWELGIGVLAAAIADRIARPLPVRVLAWGGLALAVVSAVVGGAPGFAHPGVGTLLPVAATALLLVAGASPSGSVPLVIRALGVRPAQWLGTLSFSLYLVHWPLLAFAQERAAGDGPLPFAVRLLLVAAAFPAAWLLWRFVERPFLTGRLRLAPPRRSVAAGLAAAGVLAGSLLVAVPALATVTLATDRSAADDAGPLPDGTPFVPSNLHPALADAAADTGELYADGCQQNRTEGELIVCEYGDSGGPTVVLFGDSHAGRWFPAISAALAGTGTHLVTITKSGCRSLETATTWAGAPNRSCADWRAAAIGWISEHRPQLVVLANHVGASDRSPGKVETAWRDATTSTVARFPTGARVAILAETPEFATSPPVCLSLHLDDAGACAEPRSDALNAPVLAGVRAGAATSGATFVDLTDWLCGPQECPVVIGRTLVYTDEHHLSATYSAQLAPAMLAALEPLLPAPRPESATPDLPRANSADRARAPR